jgi:hypothetical protein
MTRLRKAAMTLGPAAGPPGHPQGPRAARPQVADRDRVRDPSTSVRAKRASRTRRAGSHRRRRRRGSRRAVPSRPPGRPAPRSPGRVGGQRGGGPVRERERQHHPAVLDAHRRHHPRGSPASGGGGAAGARVVGAVDEDRVASGGVISLPASTSVRTGTATSAEVRTGRAPNRCRRWTTKTPGRRNSGDRSRPVGYGARP